MKLKARVERLEVKAGEGDQFVDIDLGNGHTVQITRLQLREILKAVEGTDTGPGPAKSRRLLQPVV